MYIKISILLVLRFSIISHYICNEIDYSYVNLDNLIE